MIVWSGLILNDLPFQKVMSGLDKFALDLEGNWLNLRPSTTAKNATAKQFGDNLVWV